MLPQRLLSLLARVEGCALSVCFSSEPDKKRCILSRKLSPSGSGAGGTGGLWQTIGALAHAVKQSVKSSVNVTDSGVFLILNLS